MNRKQSNPSAVVCAVMVAMSCGINIFESAPKDKHVDIYPDTKDHEAAIRKADKKREMRNAKRLKSWKKEKLT